MKISKRLIDLMLLKIIVGQLDITITQLNQIIGKRSGFQTTLQIGEHLLLMTIGSIWARISGNKNFREIGIITRAERYTSVKSVFTNRTLFHRGYHLPGASNLLQL